MKKMKKLLAVLLCAALLMVPLAMLASADDAKTYAPIITSSPKYPRLIYAGESVRWEVKAELPPMPEGIEGELSYEWYNYGSTRGYYGLIGTGPTFELEITEAMLEGYSRPTMRINIVVTNTYTDENGEKKQDTAIIKGEEISLDKKIFEWWPTSLDWVWQSIASIAILGPFLTYLFGGGLLMRIKDLLS